MSLFTFWLTKHLRDGVLSKTPVLQQIGPSWGLIWPTKTIMTKVPNIATDQMGHPLDHRHANKRAHWQPRTNAADATMGSHVQSRTHVRHTNRENISKKSLQICTYNPQSISDLNREDLDVMLVELESMNWDLIGISASQIKESMIEVLPLYKHMILPS